MHIDLLVPLLLTSLVTIIGWFIAHRFSMSEDRARKRRDQQTEFLIAWRSIDNATHRRDHGDPTGDPMFARVLEQAISDIQLFGNRKQVELAQQFTEDFAATMSADIDELLIDLRNDLRKELKLESAPKSITHLRIIPAPISSSCNIKNRGNALWILQVPDSRGRACSVQGCVVVKGR
jgi:hypothetical protein